MKNLCLVALVFLLTITLGFAQTTRTFIPEEDCHFAVFALEGFVEVEYWDNPTVQITTTTDSIDLAAPNITMEFHEEERVIIFETVPKTLNTDRFDASTQPMTFKIYIPKNIRYTIPLQYIPTLL